MKLTRRLYTYPVLSEEKDDYINSIFDVSFKHKMSSVNTFTLSFEFTLDNDDLWKLIEDNKAQFVVHLECSKSCFRTICQTRNTFLNYDIPIEKLNGTLEILAFVIVTDEVCNFFSDDWDEDYEESYLNFDRGTILAYKNLPSLEISKSFDEFKNTNSIFKIQHIISEEKKPMEVELNSSKICIKLCTQDYEKYKNFASKKEYQPILNAMFIFPTLVYTFESLKQSEDDQGTSGIDQYCNTNWFISLKSSYQKRGISLEDEIISEDKESIQLAQEALENVLGNALDSLKNLEELDVDNEDD